MTKLLGHVGIMWDPVLHLGTVVNAVVMFAIGYYICVVFERKMDQQTGEILGTLRSEVSTMTQTNIQEFKERLDAIARRLGEK